MKKAERYMFPAVFTYEDGQEIAVVFPDLDVATSGTDDNDALLSARELLGCALYGMEEDGEEIPTPTPLSNVNTAKNERAVLVDVYMPVSYTHLDVYKRQAHNRNRYHTGKGILQAPYIVIQRPPRRFEILR